MHGQGLGLLVLNQAESGADQADQNPQIHQVDAADPAQAVKMNRRQIRDYDVRFAGVNASGRQKRDEQENDPEPVFVIANNFKPQTMAEEGRGMPILFSPFLSNS